MSERAYVLMSGGIDSTTCFHLALRDFSEVIGVSADYGQRHQKEIEYARATCIANYCDHHILDLSALIPNTMLTDPDAPIPDVSYADLPAGVSPTYVPFRNGLMLSALSSFVVGRIGSEQATIYFGAHAEDAANWAYPDCTPEFTGAMANAIYVGTYHQVRLLVPLQYMNKAEIIRLGSGLGVDWEQTWSCYKGGEVQCGICPTCRARRNGFRKAVVSDPTTYKKVPA